MKVYKFSLKLFGQNYKFAKDLKIVSLLFVDHIWHLSTYLFQANPKILFCRWLDEGKL